MTPKLSTTRLFLLSSSLLRLFFFFLFSTLSFLISLSCEHRNNLTSYNTIHRKIRGNAMQHNTMLLYTRHRTKLNSTEDKIDFYHIKYNTILYNTVPHSTRQDNTIQSTEYRLSHHIALHRATCSTIPLHGAQRSAASSLNIHSLTHSYFYSCSCSWSWSSSYYGDTYIM